MRKQRILDAATELLKENGIDDFSVRKIAAKAGLTTGAIYHHYSNKDELLFDVMKHSLQFTHRIAESAKEENGLHGKLLLQEILTQVAGRISKTDQQKLHIILLGDILSKEREIKDKYISNYETIINNVADLYEDAFEIENSTNKRAVASLLVAAIDGIAIQQALGVLPEDLEKMIDTFINFFKESIPAYLERHK